MDRRTFARVAVVIGMLQSGVSVSAAAQEQDALIQSYDGEAAGKLKEALAALDQLPPPRRDSYLGWARRGWLQYRLGEHAASIISYRRAIALAPRAIEPRLGVLLPQLALHLWNDAEAMANEVLRVDPANYLATLRLAFVYYNRHRYLESAGLYQKLKDLYPSDTDVRSGLAWALLKAGKPQDAAREFRELIGISPRLATAHEGLKLSGGQ